MLTSTKHLISSASSSSSSSSATLFLFFSSCPLRQPTSPHLSSSHLITTSALNHPVTSPPSSSPSSIIIPQIRTSLLSDNSVSPSLDTLSSRRAGISRCKPAGPFHNPQNPPSATVLFSFLFLFSSAIDHPAVIAAYSLLSTNLLSFASSFF